MKTTHFLSHQIGFSLAIFAALLLGHSAHAITYDWLGTTSGNMSGTPANWGGTVPGSGDVARWNAATYGNPPTANGNLTIGQLLFDAGNTAGVTFGGGTSTLTLNGISGVGIQLNSGSGAVSTGSAKFSLGADQTWLNNSANTFTVGGTITNSSNSIARTLTLDGTGSTILAGVISNNSAGTTTVTKTGSGTLTLGNNSGNTFTGGLNVQQGTVKLTGTNSNSSGTGLVTIGSFGNSAVFDLNGGGRTIHSLATAGTAANQTITNSAATAATLTLNGATTSTFGGVIENGSGGGTIALTVNNASAVLTLTGANTYTGATTVTAGTLKVGATNTIAGGSALTTAAAGIFDLNGFDQTVGAISNSGIITNSSLTTKTLTFGSGSASTGAGSFTGAMNIIYTPTSNVANLSGSWSNTGNITINANASNTITLSGASINNTGTFTNSGIGVAPVVVSGNFGSSVGLITQNSASSILTLSGTNTNFNGINLTAGTLKLGSTTALGATASTLTIAGGTILDSTVADLVLANNNAIDLNGNLTFTGTQSLNLGTGAVTIAAPLTLTTAANTLTLGGNISGGTIFDITKAGAGTLVYGGNTVMTSSQTANITAGTLALTGNVTGGFGITVNGAVTLSLRGSTGNATASAITANSGSTLAFDSSPTGVTGMTRAASVNLKGASLNVLGNSTANSVDTINGALTANAPSTWGASGASTVTVTADPAANARLSATSLVRENNGAVFFRGTNLGANTIASNTAGASNIEFTTAPTAQLVGGGGAAGTQTISIIPWAVGADTAAGTVPTGFVTYEAAKGIRVLSSGEQATTITGGTSTANNVKLSGASPVTANGVTTINSLFLNNAASSVTVLAGTDALTVTSGAIFADLSLGGNNNVITVSKPINFGTTEGVIGITGTGSSKTVAFSGGVAGSGGVTIYNTGSVTTAQAGVNLGAGNTYTGDTIINGALIVSNGNALPNVANGGRTGNVYVNGTMGLSNNGATFRINGLFGDGRIITPFSSNGTLAVGDGDATSTFSGTITQTTGSIALTKVGTGTLNLTGTSSTYTNVTTIQNGTLSAVTLNNIAAPNAASSLGRPTTVANGTISLGNLTTTGTLTVVGTGETTDRVINLAGRTGGGTIDQSGTGLLKFTSDLTAPGVNSTDQRKTLTLQGSTVGTGEISGAIVDSILGTTGQKATSVTKAGTGTWTLSGTNTYTGDTTVTAGTLLISDTGSVTSNVTVQSGASIGGAGTIAGNLTLDSGSFLTFSLTDTLSVSMGAVNFGLGGFGVANLSGLTNSVAAGTYQLISGNVNTANLNNVGLANAFDLGGGKSAYFQIASLDLVVVPEPATWALLAFSLTTVMVLRRRRA